MLKNGPRFSPQDFQFNMRWFLKDAVDYYSAQASYCKSINDKDGEMWNAGKADAYGQVLSYLSDCSLLDHFDDPATSGR